jgi:hypothetical protein
LSDAGDRCRRYKHIARKYCVGGLAGAPQAEHCVDSREEGHNVQPTDR